MTNRFKDFGSGSGETFTPLSFSLYGETFNCVTALQGKFILNLISESRDDDPTAAAVVVQKFFDTVLIPESLERFNILVSDPEKIVTVETLSEITGWLVGEYTNRPTQPSEVSPNGA